MNDPKPFASLGPTLLARKGGARPAMRPQLGTFGNLGGALSSAVPGEMDDLGWNDMGDDFGAADAMPARAAEVLQLTPAPAPLAAAAPALVSAPTQAEQAEAEAAAMPEPVVKQQLRAIAAQLEKQEREPRPAARRPALEQGRRAAFTLRLDAHRHLNLRLACTARNRSAQILLTDALDRFLAEIPEIDALAAQLKRG